MATCIRVLIWADLLAMYAMWVMMTYLTDVWKLSLTHAAGIMNIWGGISLTLPIGFAYIVDTFLGNYRMLAFSSVAYSIGLGFLSLSTPPVLHKSTGTCSAYEPECIGRTQKVLFYTSLSLLAIGISGHIVSLKPFVYEQNQTQDEDVSSRNQYSGRSKPRTVNKPRKRELLIALFSVIGGIALPYIKPWSIKFGIPAICTLVATIVFLSASCLYIKKEPEGSPITHLFKVIVAAASRSAEQLPSRTDLNEGDGKLPHTDGLRWLDKAAIKSTKYEGNKWRVCTVTEVEETKIAIRMVPMWITFILCGVVFSAGNTYFQEQAKNLSTKVGKIKVPLPILLVGQQLAKAIFCRIYNSWRSPEKRHKHVPPIGILVAMIFSTLCCITAAKVEARRLDVIKSHDLADKPDETIPMNIFWVLPQFVLLAGLEAFFDSSVTDFFHDQSPTSMAKYFSHFTHGISGLGFIVSVLSVHVVGKISERGGRTNWFQYTLSESRLDYYFWTLSAMTAVNLIFFVVMGTCYPYKKPPSGEIEPDEEQGNGNGVIGEAVNSVI
ncbi:hypothetical protein Leryth_020468 [Lithospermum erythrorhizon]|nr:hypothetical protein Leryth_020468 [Lithospermum erythrorhizon]